MTQEEDIKKLMQLLQKGKTHTRTAKDIRESILNKISVEPSSDIKKEYFRRVDTSRLLKTALIYCIDNKIKTRDDGLKQDGKKLITDLTRELNENMDSPRPTIVSDGKTSKYRFKDGSESTLESYAPIKETVLENQLLNKINKLENLCSEALGFISKIEKQLWHRDDGIEEIDFTKEIEEEGENGTGAE